nr:MAG TPA: hypothetical protein [Bacteriophage sp.]
MLISFPANLPISPRLVASAYRPSGSPVKLPSFSTLTGEYPLNA